MKYEDLKKVQNKMSGKKVCLFGAGIIGQTWAYDLLEAMGFCIDFYCDNNMDADTIIRDGIKTISLETLYSLQDNVVVFITVSVRHQDSVRAQLENNGVHNIIEIDFLFLSIFLSSLIELDDMSINEQFKAVLDDVEYLHRRFEYRAGYCLDLYNPRTFNEKLQWLKLNNKQPEYTRMVDKHEMKLFVEEKIGGGYTIPTLGIWDSFEEIDFNKLPQQFVLKCAHDSGSIIFVPDKEKFDKETAKKYLNRALAINYFWIGREWPYKNAKSKIIAEPYLCDSSEKELKDYKFFCFHGKVKMIQVDFDRFSDHKRNIYNTEWEYMPFAIQYPTVPEQIIERPKCLTEMIRIAEILSEGIPHVRIDFYVINSRPLVGEITFFHGDGMEKFIPKEWDMKFGDWITLPKTDDNKRI